MAECKWKEHAQCSLNAIPLGKLKSPELKQAPQRLFEIQVPRPELAVAGFSWRSELLMKSNRAHSFGLTRHQMLSHKQVSHQNAWAGQRPLNSGYLRITPVFHSLWKWHNLNWLYSPSLSQPLSASRTRAALACHLDLVKIDFVNRWQSAHAAPCLHWSRIWVAQPSELHSTLCAFVFEMFLHDMI